MKHNLSVNKFYLPNACAQICKFLLKILALLVVFKVVFFVFIMIQQSAKFAITDINKIHNLPHVWQFARMDLF